MRWRKFSTLLWSTILIGFLSGCASKSIEYVPQYVEKEVYVPYIPNLPEIECKFQGDTSTVMKQMLDCLALHKKILNSIKTVSPIQKQGTSHAIHNRK